MTGVNGADPAENQTPPYSAEVELKGMKWTPGHIFMLYYAVLAVFASGDRTSSLQHIDIALRKHVEIR